MAFGDLTPREYIEGKHEELALAANNALSGNPLTVVSIVSMHDEPAGQMILAHPKYDKKLIAKRLRTCADILDYRVAMLCAEVLGKDDVLYRFFTDGTVECLPKELATDPVNWNIGKCGSQ